MIDKCYRCDEVISMCPCDESTYTADDEISRLRAELAECKRDNERLHVAMCQSCVCLNNGETYRGHQIIRAALAEEETR